MEGTTYVKASAYAPVLNPIQTLDIWVVGDSGLVLHFNGTAWSTQSTGTSVALHSVFAISVTDVIARGDGGVLMRLQNGNWSVIASGTSNTLHSVWPRQPRTCGLLATRARCSSAMVAPPVCPWQFRHPQLCTPWLGLVSMTSCRWSGRDAICKHWNGEWKKAGCASGSECASISHTALLSMPPRAAVFAYSTAQSELALDRTAVPPWSLRATTGTIRRSSFTAVAMAAVTLHGTTC